MDGLKTLKALVERWKAADRRIAERIETLTLEDVAERQRATNELLAYLNEDYHNAQD